MTLKDNYVRIERDFDEEGNTTAERYYDANGKMIPCKDGYDEMRIVDGEKVFFLNGELYIPAEEEPVTEESAEDAAS